MDRLLNLKWIAAGVIFLFALGFFKVGYSLVKFNLDGFVNGVVEVPGFMVEQSFGVVTSDDMAALRKGACSHAPIRIASLKDGSAILTCGYPTQTGPMKLFLASSVSI